MQISAVQTYFTNNIKFKNYQNSNNFSEKLNQNTLPQINSLSNVYYPTFGGNIKLKTAKKAFEKLSRSKIFK